MRVDRYKVGRKQLLESRDAVKAARPVRRGDDGKGATSHLVSVLPYFLELGEEHSEHQLETAILAKVQPFLQEMGGVFSFIGSQHRLKVGNREYYIDLLLYHRALRCLVAIDLKIGEFEPEYVGKMQFYLAVLDDKMRMPYENPSIGIILCKSKDKTTVEYALKDATKPIGVATYQTFSALPQELQGQLPGPEQVAKLLEGIE